MIPPIQPLILMIRHQKTLLQMIQKMMMMNRLTKHLTRLHFVEVTVQPLVHKLLNQVKFGNDDEQVYLLDMQMAYQGFWEYPD